MSDPKEKGRDMGGGRQDDNPPLEKTIPPMDQHQRDGGIPDAVPLDQTIPEMRDYLGSRDGSDHITEGDRDSD